MPRFARTFAVPNALPAVLVMAAFHLFLPLALGAQSPRDRAATRTALQQANNNRSGTVEVDGQQYVVSATLVTTYLGTTATAVVQKDGVEIGRAAMDKNGVISVTAPDPQDTDAKRATAGLVFKVVTKFKADQENAATAAPAPPPQAGPDPNAAQRARLAADTARMQANLDKLNRRTGGQISGEAKDGAPTGEIKVEFTESGIVATDNKGPIRFNTDATDIRLSDRGEDYRLLFKNISGAAATGNAAKGVGISLLHGAYSGKINGATKFYEIGVFKRGSVDKESGEPKVKKIGTTKDIAVGTVGIARERAEADLDNLKIARAYFAEQAIAKAAQGQGKSFSPDADAVAELKRVADTISPAAMRF